MLWSGVYTYWWWTGGAVECSGVLWCAADSSSCCRACDLMMLPPAEKKRKSIFRYVKPVFALPAGGRSVMRGQSLRDAAHCSSQSIFTTVTVTVTIQYISF